MKTIFNDPDIRQYMSLACVYSPRDIIVYEGDPCHSIGFIAYGDIELVHYDQEGRSLRLATLNKHEIFGDFLIHADRPFYPGDLVAKEESAVFFLSRDNLDYLIDNHKRFRSFYLNYLSKKALEFSLDNKMLRLHTLRERILFYIEKHRASPTRKRIDIESKEALAKTLNVQRPSLSRELAKMKKEGLIAYDRHSITLL
ncbi:MAG: Crp/Fnr family transcriptional regulator [Candidatus Izemoplasmataceae bacterium]